VLHSSTFKTFKSPQKGLNILLTLKIERKAFSKRNSNMQPFENMAIMQTFASFLIAGNLYFKKYNYSYSCSFKSLRIIFACSKQTKVLK